MHTTHARSRATHLREQAATLPEPLAVAYRRRAAELELQAHCLEHLQPLAMAA